MGKHKTSLMAISLLVGLIMTSVALLGHHGTGISYDETHPSFCLASLRNSCG